MNQSQYEKRKAYFASYKKKRRDKRLSLIAIHQQAQATQKTPIAFRAVRVRRDGTVVTLPPYMNKVLKACHELIDNPYRFKRLWQYGGRGMNNQRARLIVARVLAVILARCDLIDGRIGIPTQNGVDTISHHSLMCDYVLRFGQNIEESSWINAVQYLERAGYLTIQEINIGLTEGDGTAVHRSISAYKQFNADFFDDLRVTYYKNVAVEIKAQRDKQARKGFCFEWIPFYRFVSRLAEALNIPMGGGQYHLADQGAFSPH